MKKKEWGIAGSLNALVVLEAAVRNKNFSIAAQQLNLSQPAVSRHVATLEDRLGQPLFHRDNNKIVPTDHACKLASAVALGFGHVDQVWKDITAPPERDDVVLACTFGLAEQWLMPRFLGLRRAMKGARVRILTTDQLGDIDLSRVDAAVVWTLDQAPDRPALPLFAEMAFPICSPEFAARELNIQGQEGKDLTNTKSLLDGLPANKFLHFDVGQSGFLSWTIWFTKAGLKVPRFDPVAPFDAYPFMLQAVLGGEGVALGWQGLVDELLAQGRIIQIGPTVTHRQTAYYLQHRPIRAPDGALARLVNWFDEQVAGRQ